MGANKVESHGAVAGQVERSVRPRAWIGPVWQLMNDSIYEAWSEKYPDDAQHFAPLYDQAALDAAVATERERPRQVIAYMATNREGEMRFTDNQDAARELEGYGWAITPLADAGPNARGNAPDTARTE